MTMYTYVYTTLPYRLSCLSISAPFTVQKVPFRKNSSHVMNCSVSRMGMQVSRTSVSLTSTVVSSGSTANAEVLQKGD